MEGLGIIASFFIGAAIVVSIFVNIYYSNKQMGKQTEQLDLQTKQSEHQTKVESARLMLEMQKRFFDDDFRRTTRFLNGELMIKVYDADTEIRKMMNHFERMGIFMEDGALTWNHIYQIHGHVLRKLKENESAKMIYEKRKGEDKDFYFIYLQKLFDRL